MKYFLLLIFLLVSMAPQNVFALCVAGVSLQNVPASVTFAGGSGGYSVYDSTEYMQTLNFDVFGPVDVATCRYYVTLSAGSSGNPSQRTMLRGAASLDYNAYTNSSKSNVLSDSGGFGAGGVISGNFPVLVGLGQTNHHSLSWSVRPSQLASANAALFQDTTLTLTVYAEGLFGFAQTDTKTITFGARAESSVDLSLVDTSGAFNSGDTAQTISFGTLSSGEVLSYDTVIRSNDGYMVTMQSANKQKMLYKAPPIRTDTVPYSLTFGGTPVNLTSGNAIQAIASSGTVTQGTGDRFATTFTVGTLTGAEAAGNYQDVITVTVSAH